MNLPAFTPKGMLPPGDFELSLQELRESHLVKPPGRGYKNWDQHWRARLVDSLEVVAGQLWRVGITEIYLDGSFVENKDHPHDIDGYFVCSLEDLRTGRLVRDLNLLDPFQVWTWDPKARRACSDSPKRQLPMWHQYRVELYPHYGQSSGILDEFGNELEFPAAFRKSRRLHAPRGIVKLRRS